IRCGLPPSAVITQISYSPFAFESKAILAPSGDQRGVVTDAPPNEVSCRAFNPSLSHDQTSAFPERSEINAIFLPSSEYWGEESFRLEEIKEAPPLWELMPGSRSPFPRTIGAIKREMLV